MSDAAMSKNDGGPAFPTSNGGSPDDGMTLRDYFAAKAMNAMLSNFDWMTHAAQNTNIPGEDAVVIMAYEIADAMLKERAK